MAPFKMVRKRLKSIGFNIQPSIPSLCISSRCCSRREAETAKMGIRPLSSCDRRSNIIRRDCSRSRIRSVASYPLRRGILIMCSAVHRNQISTKRRAYWISMSMQSKFQSDSTMSRASWPFVVSTTVCPSKVKRFLRIMRLMSLSFAMNAVRRHNARIKCVPYLDN